MYFIFLTAWLEIGGKSAGLPYGTKEEEGSQLSEFLVMADGRKSDRLKEESLPTCSSFSGRGNRKWWSSRRWKIMYIAVQRQSYEGFWIISPLQTPVTSAHCLSSQSSSAVCLSDCRTWLHLWHTLAQMILIVSDILSEPLLSPLGKAHPRWLIHWQNEK